MLTTDRESSYIIMARHVKIDLMAAETILLLSTSHSKQGRFDRVLSQVKL